MWQVIILTAAMLAQLQTTEPVRDWAWFRATSTNSAWWVTEGAASVMLESGKFEARLYDKTEPQFLRLTLIGDARGRQIHAKVRVEESDDPVRTMSGRLRRSCWSTGGGREVLLLSDGLETIGILRELAPKEPCKPA